jgi:hypothetical protein
MSRSVLSAAGLVWQKSNLFLKFVLSVAEFIVGKCELSGLSIISVNCRGMDYKMELSGKGGKRASGEIRLQV